MEIRTYGDPSLRRPAAPVEEVDDEIRAISATMVEAMLRAHGAGLAAPQIGISKRIIVLDVDGEFHVLINPELIETSDEVEESIEGCLSVPGVDAAVARATRAVVEGTTLDGETVRIEGRGLLARAIQHEIDHLNGSLFLDRVSPARRQSVVREYQRRQREESP
jgi:peptide deformylase